MKERGREYRIPKTPYAHGLRELSIRKRDVHVFSQMYGKTDGEAATELISQRFDGREIADWRGSGFNAEVPRITRTSAAREVFVEYFGAPLKQRRKKNRTQR